MDDVYALTVRHQSPKSWRGLIGIGLLLPGILGVGVGLLFLQGGSLLGLVPAIPGGLLIWAGGWLTRPSDRSGRLLCEAQVTGDTLRIGEHDVHLSEDFVLVIGSSFGVVIATFIQGGVSKTLAWMSYSRLSRTTDTDERAVARLREAWGFEAPLRELQISAPGARENFGGALLKAVERNAEHDRLEVLRRRLKEAALGRPDPEHRTIAQIRDGAPGRSVPYRGGATTPADGQRFLDDFRAHALELVPEVHVSADYVTVRRLGSTTVIPIGSVTAEAHLRSLELTQEDARQSVEMPGPASAEVIAGLLRLHDPG